jgi:hypothetical protein
VRRKVRQHTLDVDLEGLPGWALEVKRAARADQYRKRVWWKQCAEQAQALQMLPLLLYRVDRKGWRCVWPAGSHLSEGEHDLSSWEATLTASPITWWQMVRLLGVRRPAGTADASPAKGTSWPPARG